MPGGCQAHSCALSSFEIRYPFTTDIASRQKYLCCRLHASWRRSRHKIFKRLAAASEGLGQVSTSDLWGRGEWWGRENQTSTFVFISTAPFLMLVSHGRVRESRTVTWLLDHVLFTQLLRDVIVSWCWSSVYNIQYYCHIASRDTTVSIYMFLYLSFYLYFVYSLFYLFIFLCVADWLLICFNVSACEQEHAYLPYTMEWVISLQ